MHPNRAAKAPSKEVEDVVSRVNAGLQRTFRPAAAAGNPPKVDIGAISISEVAEQYLAEAERIEALDLDVASDFLLVAATLLDIKAASLVPQEAPRKVDDDDDEFDEDLEELSTLDGDALREVLIQRLIAYKQFKGAAAALGARMQAESRMHPRVAGPDPEFLGLMPDYLAGITLRGLAVICADLDGKRQTFLLEAEHVAPHRVPLDLTVASSTALPWRTKPALSASCWTATPPPSSSSSPSWPCLSSPSVARSR